MCTAVRPEKMMKQITDYYRPALVATSMLALAAASGCGQKGPLYLPGNPSEMQTIEPGVLGGTEDDEEADSVDEPLPPGAESNEQA